VSRVRVGTVFFLNAEPLVVALDPERFEVVTDHPAGIARRLRDGELDLALAPVAVALEEGLPIAPGWCIGGKGPVRSVLLVAETPPEQWTAVRLDGASRTSVVLAKLLLTRGPLAVRVRADLAWLPAPPGGGLDEARGTEASLVIGDAALDLPDRLVERLDLCACWTEWTGLPFVFAAWTARRDVPADTLAALREAGRRGVGSIASRFAGRDADYLLNAIRYPLDDEALVGLRRFAALAREAGLLAASDVVLIGPAATPRPPPLQDVMTRVSATATPTREDLALLAEGARTADLCLLASLRARPDAPPASVAVRVHVADPGATATLAEAAARGATEALIVGSMDPADLRRLWNAAPSLRFWGRGTDPAGLARAGLFGWSSDGAGTFDADVRAGLGAITPEAARAELAAAAAAGLRVDAELVLGQGEGDAARLDDLEAWDRIGMTGAVDVLVVRTAARQGPYGSDANTAVDLVRWVALARLALHRVARVAVATDTEGPGLAQVGTYAGADAVGRWVLGPDSATWSVELAEVRRHERGISEGPQRRTP
jgi:predicted solute-binding protein